MKHLPTGLPRRSGVLALFLILTGTVGCSAPPKPKLAFEEVRSTVTIRDRDGELLSWKRMIEGFDDSDVIVLGELHDDHVAHLVQRAVVEDVADRRPGTILAMEMLERDEQPVLDDYREGLISPETFTKLTFSGSWAGEGSWDDWYLPIIDSAHARDVKVIAANAPRRYVTLARTDGFERLARLPDDRRRFVEWPDPPIEDGYRKRFMDLMSDDGEREIDEEIAESYFRAQQIWDATMAGSVAMNTPTDGGVVILMLGRFHSDFDGGTIVMLRRMMPGARITVVSLGPPDEDEGTPADLMIRDPRTED